MKKKTTNIQLKLSVGNLYRITVTDNQDTNTNIQRSCRTGLSASTELAVSYMRIINDISVRLLQSAIDALVSWSSTWQLEIAVVC